MSEVKPPADLGGLRIDAPAARPGLRRSLPLVELLILACLLLVAWLLLKDRLPGLLPAANGAVSVPDTEPAADAAATASMPAARPGEIVAGGYIEIIPPGASIVSSDVDARITAILAVPGQHVSRGELLARLDSSQLELELGNLIASRNVSDSRLSLARAGSRSEEIEAAEAGVRSAEAQRQLAMEEAQRAVELYDKGVISQAEMRGFETARDTAVQDLSEAQARLSLLANGTRPEEIDVAEAALREIDSHISELRWKIGQCQVKSPVDGVVLEQLADIGDWAGVAKDDPASAAILSIYDPSLVQAWADINQRDSGLLSVGQSVTLTTDAQPQRSVPGRLSAIMPLASMQKNTVQVKIAIDNPPPDFRPGLGVRVAIDTSAEQSDDNAAVRQPDSAAADTAQGGSGDE